MLERDAGQSVRQFEWPDDYYMETDGMRRKALLDQALAAEDTEENRMRLLLWNKRYTDHKGKYDGTDHFFRVWVDLPFIVRECNSFLGKRKAGKRRAEVLETRGLNIPEENPEYRDLWYREFVNFCSTYIQISRNDRSYSTTLFGIGAIPEDNLLKKIAADLCKRAIEYPCLHTCRDNSGKRRSNRPKRIPRRPTYRRQDNCRQQQNRRRRYCLCRRR